MSSQDMVTIQWGTDRMRAMKPKKTPKARLGARSHAIREAVLAVEKGDREAVLRLLDKVRPGEEADAPIDERWLAAERAYLHAEYENAVNRFGDVEADDRISQLQPWQRFLSLQRRAFATLQLGDLESFNEFIEKAVALCRSDPKLLAKECDVAALRAHRAELDDDFESARQLLRIAHEKAVEHRVWERAATSAADLVRIAGIIGDPAGGLRWVAATREVLAKKANPRVERTLRLREGMLYSMLGREREALGLFAELIREGQAVPAGSELLVDVLGRRADLHRRAKRFADAEDDLRQALRLAEERSLRRHALYLELDYATLSLERPDPNGSAAYDHFLRALSLLQDLQLPPRRLLRQMAELVVGQPKLIGRTRLPSSIANELLPALQDIDRLGKPLVYQRGSWDHRSARAYERLRGVLKSVLGPPVRLLSGAELYLDSGKLKGPGKFRQFPPAQLRVLRVLFEHSDTGITLDAIADELGDSSSAVQKSIERIKVTIDSDLKIEGRGRARRVYTLLLAERDPT
jgi:tetratricopeptide (TPR) repeat protein